MFRQPNDFSTGPEYTEVPSEPANIRTAEDTRRFVDDVKDILQHTELSDDLCRLLPRWARRLPDTPELSAGHWIDRASRFENKRRASPERFVDERLNEQWSDIQNHLAESVRTGKDAEFVAEAFCSLLTAFEWRDRLGDGPVKSVEKYVGKTLSNAKRRRTTHKNECLLEIDVSKGGHSHERRLSALNPSSPKTMVEDKAVDYVEKDRIVSSLRADLPRFIESWPELCLAEREAANGPARRAVEQVIEVLDDVFAELEMVASDAVRSVELVRELAWANHAGGSLPRIACWVNASLSQTMCGWRAEYGIAAPKDSGQRKRQDGSVDGAAEAADYRHLRRLVSGNPAATTKIVRLGVGGLLTEALKPTLSVYADLLRVADAC